MASKKNITYIIGHKNPDTDSIVSAIAYADLKKRLGFKNIIAARAGVLNQQTEYILSVLNVSPPIYLTDLKIKVKDIMSGKIIAINENESFYIALKKFKKNKIRFLPVINNNNEPIGYLTLSIVTDNLLKFFESTHIYTSINLIKDVLGGEITGFNKFKEGFLKAKIILATGSIKTFRKRLMNSDLPKIIITDDRKDILEEIWKHKNIKLVVFSKNLQPTKTIIVKSHQHKTILIFTKYNTTKLVFLLKQAIPIILLAAKNPIKIQPDKTVEEIQDIMENIDIKGITVVDDKDKLIGIVTKSLLLSKPNKKVILVDHNEATQAIDGIDDIEIKEIVDHHRISPIKTDKPITFINYPVGSTSTIISMLYKNNEIKPSKIIAKLLIAGILSDTVILHSPTTTKTDLAMIKWLNSIAEFDYKKFANDFFKAGSKIDYKNIAKLIISDFKNFDMNGNKVGIGQIETVGFSGFYKYKKKFYSELQKLQLQHNYVLVALLITDISLQTSLLLTSGQDKIIRKLPYKRIEKNLYELTDVLSRKKQVVPLINRLFT